MSSDNASVFNAGANSAPPRAPDKHVKDSFDVPVELIALPSGGVLYGTDSPLHDSPQAEIRCMTAREEDLITSSAVLKQGLVLQKLLKSCLINKSIDIDSLLIGDRNALLIGIRTISYGAEYKAQVTCGSCGVQYESEFMLNQLMMKELSAEPVSAGINLFEFVLPVSKHHVRFSLMTLHDSHEISVLEERKRKAKIAGETRITTPLTMLIKSVNGDTDRVKISNFVQNMRAGDSRALRAYMSKIEPGVNMTQESTCTSCGASSEVTVPIGASFFWPDIEG